MMGQLGEFRRLVKNGAILVLGLFLTCMQKKEPKNPQYAPYSTCIVHLQVLDDLREPIWSQASVFTNIPKDVSESRNVTVQVTGDYYLEITIDRPTKGSVGIGRSNFNILAVPGDTTHIQIAPVASDFKIAFFGKGAEINNFYLEKEGRLGYTDIRTKFVELLSKVKKYDSLKRAIDHVANVELNFLKEYPKRDELPQWFVDFERAEITFGGMGFKTQLPHTNEMVKYFDDHLTSDYYDFLDEVRIDDPSAVLSTFYFWFLEDYFLKDLAVSEFDYLKGFSRASKTLSHILKKAKEQLTEPTRQLFLQSQFSQIVKYYKNPLDLDSLAGEFEIKDYREFTSMVGTRSKDDIEFLNMTVGDTIPNFFLVDNYDSLVSLRSFKDKLLYINFWATWCGPCVENLPKLNEFISGYQKDSRVLFLNICVDSEKDKWLAALTNRGVMGINLIAEGGWNSKLRSFFNIEGIPQYVIVGKGNVLLENFSNSPPMVKVKIDTILEDL